MATSSYDSPFAVDTYVLHIQPGHTLAAYQGVTSLQLSSTVKYLSGGSLLIIGMAQYTTLSAANLETKGASGFYMMGTTEVLTINGASAYYLAATGATVVVSKVMTFSQAAGV